MKHLQLHTGLAIACLAAASVASAQSGSTDRSAVKAENRPVAKASKPVTASTTATTAATTPGAVRAPTATTAVTHSVTKADKSMSKQGSYEGCHGIKQIAEADL